MKTPMKTLILAAVLGFVLPIGALQAAEDDEAADASQEEADIQTLVTEAQRMAREWAERIREWKDGGERRTTYMGVVIESVPDVLRDYIDLPKGVGLLFSHIAEGSPAEKAGLKDNDIIVTFDGQLIVNYSQLSTLIELRGPGAEVPVTVLRKGEEKEFTITLEERIRRGGTFVPTDVPEAPDAPEVPDINDIEVGAFMEQVEEWIPGSVRVFIDENEQVHVDLQELKEDLQDLKIKLQSMKESTGSQLEDIRREYGDLGARTTIVRVEERDVNFRNKDGKLVLTSSEAGQQAMVWDNEGNLVYEGELPADYAEVLPEKAVRLINAYNESRMKLDLDGEGDNIEIRFNDEAIDPVTLLDR